jgi:DNA-binding transcriptional MocR family regulator
MSDIQNHCVSRKAFADSQEARYRARVRSFVRMGPFTKSERDILKAFVDHWLHHRKSKDGVVYPGRKRLAKRAGVTGRTVTSALALFRASGMIVATARLEGRDGKATEYWVDADRLEEVCRMTKAQIQAYGWKNCTLSGVEKISTRNKTSNVIPFRVQGGGK